MRLLVVEDDPKISHFLVKGLREDQHLVDLVEDGDAAEAQGATGNYDAILLDLMLPGVDGFEVCRRLRAAKIDTPILVITARDAVPDRVKGLDVGADDYLVKPFSPRELIARVRAMLRRPRAVPVNPAVTVLGDLTIDAEARKVTVAGTPIDLTRTEFDLLAAMADRPRAAFSRRQLITEVWGADWYGDEHLVDVHIGHLRRKLGDDATEPRYVRTVRGVGYGLGDG